MQSFESRLRINFKKFDIIKKTFRVCEKLGIKNIILEPSNNNIKITPQIKKRIKDSTKINCFFRITLSSKNVREIRNKIRLCKDREEIITVESSNVEVQKFAATDTRVDLISFSRYPVLKTFSKGVISLINQNNKFIEFSLTHIMNNNRSFQSKVFRRLHRSIKIALQTNSKFIINGNFKNLYDLRNPRALVSISHTLIGISLLDAKNAFSRNVRYLLEKVEQRNNKNIFEEGVELL
jgi:RNase P/RNase MRP subunit p30